QASFEDRTVPGRLVSLSLEGGAMEFPPDTELSANCQFVVAAHGFPRLFARVDTVVTEQNGSVLVRFKFGLEGEARDQMIVKLYTGGYSQEIPGLDRLAIASGIWRRAFGRTSARAWHSAHRGRSR